MQTGANWNVAGDEDYQMQVALLEAAQQQTDQRPENNQDQAPKWKYQEQSLGRIAWLNTLNCSKSLKGFRGGSGPPGFRFCGQF